MKTSEKVAYIKGMIEGMALDTSKDENKILTAVVDVLEELSMANNALTEENIKLKDYVDELDHDLGELEEYVYDSDDYDDGEFDDDDDDEEYEYEEYGADGDDDEEDDEDDEDKE